MANAEHENTHLLAAKTGFDPRTVLRWWRGERVNRGTAITLERMAAELEIARPEQQREAS